MIEPEEEPARSSSGQGAHREEDVDVPQDWPTSGKVEFRNVTVKYDPSGPAILKDINLTFGAGERVAVVGRTGSGKSTLVLSLLRLTHVASGAILYDGVDITRVPRARLRRALTLIPQEAVLFSGTVGSNLDPTGDAAPGTMRAALDACAGVASFRLRRRPADGAEPSETQPLLGGAAGLSPDAPVAARGENFSHGQRQVLSLCRALLRRSPLMLLDEATAMMDYATDRAVQEVLRRDLAAPGARGGGRTLVTVAHRLRTVADYEAIVVLGAGRVLEVGSPAELMLRGGVFADMVRHGGEADELERLISEAADGPSAAR